MYRGAFSLEVLNILSPPASLLINSFSLICFSFLLHARATPKNLCFHISIMNSPTPNKNMAIYPSIIAFEALISRNDLSSNPGTQSQATALVELCNTVSRDLIYLGDLMEDATSALRGAPPYHTQWADEVRKTAARSLNQVNSYIASKIPGTAQPLFKPQDLSSSASRSKLSDVLKDVTSVAAMQQQLAVAHTAMVGVMGLLHQLAIQRNATVEGRGEPPSVQPKHSTSSFQRASFRPASIGSSLG